MVVGAGAAAAAREAGYDRCPSPRFAVAASSEAYCFASNSRTLASDPEPHCRSPC